MGFSRYALGLIGATAVAAGVSIGVSQAVEDRHVMVVRVIDGDTIEVDEDGQTVVVRLMNVDTPETRHPDEPVGCLGPEATKFLEQLLPAGTGVELRTDTVELDRYGRTVAGVFLTDTLINAEIARAGFGRAVTYDGQDDYFDEVAAAEAAARDAAVGGWHPTLECSPVTQVATVADDLDAAEAAAAAVAAEVDVEDTLEVDAVIALQEAAEALAETLNESSRLDNTMRASSWMFRDGDAVIASRETLARHHNEAVTSYAELLDVRDDAAAVIEEQQLAERQRQVDAIVNGWWDDFETRHAALLREEAEAAAAAEEAARQAAAEEDEQQSYDDSSEGASGNDSYDSGDGQSGGGGGPGYTGNRCYNPGGKTYRPC
ncbi:hypothetical protein GC722_05465 [Auraticoccus sp. F435]|uniref:TNase-like domain-containing protein n=1 Tax=Auraticoccus cholistanensis TaxID=2656650 RepID=A0A6A9V0F1_9ACTN|nr:thermonuclease family protein [Auraticoccus cholistanensis]MVA75479.1 hypothetical protein [Auraticoccus cholistanensis]